MVLGSRGREGVGAGGRRVHCGATGAAVAVPGAGGGCGLERGRVSAGAGRSGAAGDGAQRIDCRGGGGCSQFAGGHVPADADRGACAHGGGGIGVLESMRDHTGGIRNQGHGRLRGALRSEGRATGGCDSAGGGAIRAKHSGCGSEAAQRYAGAAWHGVFAAGKFAGADIVRSRAASDGRSTKPEEMAVAIG